MIQAESCKIPYLKKYLFLSPPPIVTLTKFKSKYIMIEYLFSYGTLQLEKVQIESFGRILKGTKDSLMGYKLISLEITDENVLKQSEQRFHPMAVPSDRTSDHVDGVVFEVTNEELSQADKYEVADYKRIVVTLESGKKAWIYVAVR